MNVAIIGSPGVINGGTLPTSGPAGELGDFVFSNLAPGTITGATLAPFDTVVLNVASVEMLCTTATLSAAEKAALNAFLNTAGKKLIIYDSECAPGVGVDYSWFKLPFTTNNPGAIGLFGGVLNIVEENFLSSSDPNNPHFIDTASITAGTDAVGDMNVMVSRDARWCVDMDGTNVNNPPVTGPVHTYGRPSVGGGLAIYNGLDVDFINGNHIRKLWVQELQQPLDGGGLLFNEGGCITPDGSGIKKTPRLANLWLCNTDSINCRNKASGVESLNLPLRLNTPVRGLDPKCTGFPNFAPPETCDAQTIGSFEFEVRFDAKYVDVDVTAGDIWDDRGEEVGLFCESIEGEGFEQFRCNTKGKPGDAETGITGPGTLANIRVTPTADVYSILVANQLNGIATQLINQDCQFSDTQGHPLAIPVAPQSTADPCGDSAVTIRYLEGDVHADCEVNVQDQQQIAFRWGSRLGQLLYNSRYDLEPSYPKKGDSDIDAKDLQLVYGRAGSTCKDPHPDQDPVDPKSKESEPVNGGA